MKAPVALARPAGAVPAISLPAGALIWLAFGACVLALLMAGGLHVIVGIQHLSSTSSIFGVLAIAAGVAQTALGAALILHRPTIGLLRAVVVLNAVLVQLYVLNVTVGLPPAIAHSHVTGSQAVWVFTLAWPGPIEWQGLLTLAFETVVLGFCYAAWPPRSERPHR